MRVQLQPPHVPTSFKITQKVQLTYKLFLLESARNVLNKELDNLANKAYEEVHDFLNSSFPTSAFRDLSDTLDAKCQAIEKLSAFIKNLKITSQPQNVDKNDTKTDLHQSVREGKVFKFGSKLQNMFMTSSICKAVQVLGATLRFQHFKHLVVPRTSEVQAKDVIFSASPRNNSSVQDTESLKETEQVNVEKCSTHETVQTPAICDTGKTNTQKPLLPPIPAILPTTGYNEQFVGVPVTKWGREDDIQLQHQKQTSTQLLHFLKVKAKNTGALNVTVLEWSNSFSGLPKPPCPSHNITKQTYQFKHDANLTWPTGLLSDTENHAPLFKLKRVDSSGSLTYTCVIATKTELWDIGDIVTDLYRSESSSVSSDENGQVMASEETLQWLDATIHKDPTSTKVPTINAITIPEFQNKRFEEIEVMVSHIVSPGSFYIQHADASEKLQALVSDTWKESSSYAKQNCIPDIGTKVIGWFSEQQQWCRSQVTKICGISKDNINDCTKEMSVSLEVKRLDYGDSFCLSLSNIKELTSEMAALPLQAVHVSLAHVSPVNGKDWSEEAVGWFRAMVHNRTLYARLYPEGHKVTVELFLEKGKIEAMRRGASLSLRLTQNGHARHAKLKNGVGAVQLKMKKDLEWEKYLISCYTQSNLHRAVL